MSGEEMPHISPTPHPSFWQRPAVQNLLPLITSLIFHLTLLIVGILVFATTKMISRSVLREQVIIPEASIVAGAAVGGLPNPGLGNDPNLSAGQTVDQNIAVSDGWATKQSESLTTTLMAGGAADATDSVIGVGPKTGLFGGGDQGTNGGSGGPLSPYGPGGGMGLAPKSPFMGISGNARKVVYICDASGGMLQVFFRVKGEVTKAVNFLQPIQAFNVIFLRDEEVLALSKKDLIMATAANKLKALEFIEQSGAYGNTDAAVPAIRLAFAQKPDLLYLLTDGFQSFNAGGDVTAAAVAEIKKLNADKKVKINVIFMQTGGDEEVSRIMQDVAKENGGICKIVDRNNF